MNAESVQWPGLPWILPDGGAPARWAYRDAVDGSLLALVPVVGDPRDGGEVVVAVPAAAVREAAELPLSPLGVPPFSDVLSLEGPQIAVGFVVWGRAVFDQGEIQLVHEGDLVRAFGLEEDLWPDPDSLGAAARALGYVDEQGAYATAEEGGIETEDAGGGAAEPRQRAAGGPVAPRAPRPARPTVASTARDVSALAEQVAAMQGLLQDVVGRLAPAGGGGAGAAGAGAAGRGAPLPARPPAVPARVPALPVAGRGRGAAVDVPAGAAVPRGLQPAPKAVAGRDPARLQAARGLLGNRPRLDPVPRVRAQAVASAAAAPVVPGDGVDEEGDPDFEEGDLPDLEGPDLSANVQLQTLLVLRSLQQAAREGEGARDKKKDKKKLFGLPADQASDSDGEEAGGPKGSEKVERLKESMIRNPKAYAQAVERRMALALEEEYDKAEPDPLMASRYIREIGVGKQRTLGYYLYTLQAVHRSLLEGNADQARLTALLAIAACEHSCLDGNWDTGWRATMLRQPPFTEWAQGDPGALRATFAASPLLEPRWVHMLAAQAKEEEFLVKRRKGLGKGKPGGDKKEAD